MLFKAFKNPLYTMFFNERKEKKLISEVALKTRLHLQNDKF